MAMLYKNFLDKLGGNWVIRIIPMKIWENKKYDIKSKQLSS